MGFLILLFVPVTLKQISIYINADVIFAWSLMGKFRFVFCTMETSDYYLMRSKPLLIVYCVMAICHFAKDWVMNWTF